MRIRNCVRVFVGFLLLSVFAMPVRADVVLTLQGSCPGPMRANVTGAAPRYAAYLLYAPRTGHFRLPGDPCRGTVLGLAPGGLQIVGIRVIDDRGDVSFQGDVPPVACGHYLQVFTTACETSNVLVIE